MKKHLALAFSILLAGCTDADWDHALNYTGLGDKGAEPVKAASHAAAPAPAAIAAPAEPANTDFCRSIATQDASGNGFDAATQQRVFAQSYAQCLIIYTH